MPTLTDVTAAVRLCTTRKHEWKVHADTFPPYRSMRMREISLLRNLDRNRDEREQNCMRFRREYSEVKKWTSWHGTTWMYSGDRV